MRPDLITTRERLLARQTQATAEMAESIRIARSPAAAHAWLRTSFDQAQAAAADPALAGLGVSVQDLFDVECQPTPAGSDTAAVARLEAGGGLVMRRTNMSEFAFSGVGLRAQDVPAGRSGAA